AGRAAPGGPRAERRRRSARLLSGLPARRPASRARDQGEKGDDRSGARRSRSAAGHANTLQRPPPRGGLDRDRPPGDDRRGRSVRALLRGAGVRRGLIPGDPVGAARLRVSGRPPGPPGVGRRGRFQGTALLRPAGAGSKSALRSAAFGPEVGAASRGRGALVAGRSTGGLGKERDNLILDRGGDLDPPLVHVDVDLAPHAELLKVDSGLDGEARPRDQLALVDRLEAVYVAAVTMDLEPDAVPGPVQ